MAYDRGLVDRVADALLRLGERGARQKNVFGGRGFLIGKKTFVIVWGEGLIVKVPAADYDALRRLSGVTPFAPGEERPMSTWLVVEGSVVADDPELADWLRRGLAGLG
jgi:TfoX/Sxy family transcriptional regulator of competence genes